MAKFDKVAGKKVMVRFLELNGKSGVWTSCSQAVKDYASANFKSGDDVHVQYEDGQNNMFHVSKIEKGPGTDTKKGTAPAVGGGSGKPVCEDCGKDLKDAKYKKCYTCNQKNPAKKTGGSYGKTPEVQESIKRQAIGHMTSRTLISLQGHVDPNNVEAIAERLYKKYQDLVG